MNHNLWAEMLYGDGSDPMVRFVPLLELTHLCNPPLDLLKKQIRGLYIKWYGKSETLIKWPH